MKLAVRAFAAVAARVRALVWPVTVEVTENALTGITGAAATDILTKTAHGLTTGDAFTFSVKTGGAELVAGTRYYVIRLSANTFSLATTALLAAAGTAVDFTTDISAGTGNTPLDVAKSASKVERVQQEQGAGYVNRTITAFNFPVSGEYVPEIGDEFEIKVSETADEVGTSWRCFDLIRSAGGTEHRCVCFKLDDA